MNSFFFQSRATTDNPVNFDMSLTIIITLTVQAE